MPSEECFVYITLPGQTEPVTAGRYQLDTGRQGTAVGQFVYGRSYLSRSDRVEFDPVELKLQVPVSSARRSCAATSAHCATVLPTLGDAN